jgi:hypothetical protein
MQPIATAGGRAMREGIETVRSPLGNMQVLNSDDPRRMLNRIRTILDSHIGDSPDEFIEKMQSRSGRPLSAIWSIFHSAFPSRPMSRVEKRAFAIYR